MSEDGLTVYVDKCGNLVEEAQGLYGSEYFRSVYGKDGQLKSLAENNDFRCSEYSGGPGNSPSTYYHTYELLQRKNGKITATKGRLNPYNNLLPSQKTLRLVDEYNNYVNDLRVRNYERVRDYETGIMKKM